MNLKTLSKTKKQFLPFFIWPLFVIILGIYTVIKLYPDNRSGAFSMLYGVMITVTHFNAFIFAILNWKGIKRLLCIIFVTVLLTGALSYMSAFNIIVDHEKAKAGPGYFIKPGGFIYGNFDDIFYENYFYNKNQFDDLMVRLFAPRGDTTILTERCKLLNIMCEYGIVTKSILSEKISENGFIDIQNGFQYFARVRLLNKYSWFKFDNVRYTATSDATKQSISGTTDKDGYTEVIFTPELESIQFFFWVW